MSLVQFLLWQVLSKCWLAVLPAESQGRERAVVIPVTEIAHRAECWSGGSCLSVGVHLVSAEMSLYWSDTFWLPYKK